MTKLYLAIPCYNEEEVLRDSAEKLLNKYSTMMAEGKISADSRIVFIDDGSKDRTWEIISELHTENPIFQGIKLSRNRGHQNALLCGLMTLKDKADAVISIDADLQDDINTFDEMVAKYEDGCDVVYGVRSKRETDTFFKRFTAEGFYKILNHMGAKVIFNHADFRLMSKRALNAFSLYKETNIFLRGMVPMIGFKSDIVTYERSERLAGESKYPLKKMLALAWEGITSLSIQPIRIITWLGAIVFGISLIMIIYSLISFFCGWSFGSAASIESNILSNPSLSKKIGDNPSEKLDIAQTATPYYIMTNTDDENSPFYNDYFYDEYKGSYGGWPVYVAQGLNCGFGTYPETLMPYENSLLGYSNTLKYYSDYHLKEYNQLSNDANTLKDNIINNGAIGVYYYNLVVTLKIHFLIVIAKKKSKKAMNNLML